MKEVMLTATKKDQTFKIIERMGFVDEQLKRFKTTVYRLEENNRLLSVDLRPQLEMYKRILLKEGFEVTELKNHSLDALISAYKIGLQVNIEEFYCNESKLEISAYIEGSKIKGAKTFFINEDQFIFILEKMGFLVDSSDGIFDAFNQKEFDGIHDIYDFYDFTELQKTQILKHYLLYKMYV